MYIKAIFKPNIPKSKTKATSLIIGEATRKEKVVPSGTPASRKPINKGIAEQVQNGVIIPRSDANTLPEYFLSPDSTFLIFYGGKKERIIETIKIMTANNIIIFMVSKIKKLTDEANNVSLAIPKTE